MLLYGPIARYRSDCYESPPDEIAQRRMCEGCVSIYIVGCNEGPIKVGISRSPLKRCKSIQTGCPFAVVLLYEAILINRTYAIKRERRFHREFAKNRLTGEWFNISADVAIKWMSDDGRI